MTGFIFTSEKLGVFPNLDWEDYCPFADNKIPPAQGGKGQTSQGGLGSACLVVVQCSPRNCWELEVKAEGRVAAMNHTFWAGIFILSLRARGGQCCCLLVTGRQVPVC